VGHELSLACYFFLNPGGQVGLTFTTVLFGTPGFTHVIFRFAPPETSRPSSIDAPPPPPPDEVPLSLMMLLAGEGFGDAADLLGCFAFADGVGDGFASFTGFG
jgi:hypothetical protein